MGGFLERLYQLLEPLRLYSLGQDSLVDKELRAYEAGAALLEKLLEEIEVQAHVQTSRGEGLGLYEKLVGLQERPDVEPATRRELVMYRLAVAPFDFHLKGMHGSVRAAGIDAQITEHFIQEYLTVRSRRMIDPLLDTDTAKARLDAMLPAHLSYHFDYGELTWDLFEAASADWNTWDALDFSWEEFDLKGQELFTQGGG